MNMSIKGGSKTQQNLVTEVAHWAARKVLGPRLMFVRWLVVS